MTDRRPFFAELQRRNVLRAAALYAGGAWLLVQVVTQVGPVFNLPSETQRWIIIAAAIGFPFAMSLSWFYEWTPQGFKREDEVEVPETVRHSTGRKLDFAIIAVLSIAVVLLLANTFVRRDETSDLTAAPAGKSIAVLPFDNRSGDAGQAYYADGLTDELTTTLARISALKVIARTSAARFRGSKDAPSAIGRELGVATLVTGSVLRVGGRVRYTAELVQASDEKTLWSDSFERDEKDVLTLQSEVAQAIARAIAIRLSPTEATRLAGARTVDPRAFDEYLRGRALWNQRSEASVREALVHFQNSTRIDPNFALGYTGIADSNIILGVWGFEPPRTVMPLAKAAAQHAIELDPNAGEPHASLGDIHFHYDWDFDASTREHAVAIELAPGFATAYQWAAEPLEVTGDYAGAIAKLRHAQELDPLSMIIRAQLARTMVRSGKRDQAIAFLRDAIALDPKFLRTRRELVAALLGAKRNKDALAAARELVAIDPLDAASQAQLGLALGRNGLEEEANEVLAKLDAESKRRFVSALERARVSAGLGNRAATLTYLEAAVIAREGNVPLLATDEEFDFLHDDPRYAAILHAIATRAP